MNVKHSAATHSVQEHCNQFPPFKSNVVTLNTDALTRMNEATYFLPSVIVVKLQSLSPDYRRRAGCISSSCVSLSSTLLKFSHCHLLHL